MRGLRAVKTKGTPPVGLISVGQGRPEESQELAVQSLDRRWNVKGKQGHQSSAAGSQVGQRSRSARSNVKVKGFFWAQDRAYMHKEELVNFHLLNIKMNTKQV